MHHQLLLEAKLPNLEIYFKTRKDCRETYPGYY